MTELQIRGLTRDPVAWALGRGHEVALDLLDEALRAPTVDRALAIATATRELVETLQHIEMAALNRADDMNNPEVAS